MTQTVGPSRPDKAHAEHPLTPIWVAVIGALGALGAALVAKFGGFGKRKKTSALIDGLEAMSQIDDLLSEFAASGADRALLFEGKNGGSLPRPGRAWRVSAMQYWVGPGVDDSAIGTYRNLNVDGSYRKMLIQAARDERRLYNFHTDQEPECQLKRYYELENVTHSIIVVLGERDDSLIFLSAARHGGEFNREEITHIEMTAHKLRQAVCPGTGGSR